jgi:hypothetical protein
MQEDLMGFFLPLMSVLGSSHRDYGKLFAQLLLCCGTSSCCTIYWQAVVAYRAWTWLIGTMTLTKPW